MIFFMFLMLEALLLNLTKNSVAAICKFSYIIPFTNLKTGLTGFKEAVSLLSDLCNPSVACFGWSFSVSLKRHWDLSFPLTLKLRKHAQYVLFSKYNLKPIGPKNSDASTLGIEKHINAYRALQCTRVLLECQLKVKS